MRAVVALSACLVLFQGTSAGLLGLNGYGYARSGLYPGGLYSGLPYKGYAGYAPYAYAGIPSSQYAVQDGYGNVKYGYSNINSAKQEVGNAYGGVTGSYSYVDSYGIPQRVDYIADGLGFRVKGTNLPVAPAVPITPPLVAPVFNLVGPDPVEDTEEVAAAKAEFQEAFDAAVAANAPAEEVAAEEEAAEEEAAEEGAYR